MKLSIIFVVSFFVWQAHSQKGATGHHSPAIETSANLVDFQCLTEVTNHRSPSNNNALRRPRHLADHRIRSFRLAVAASGEYTEFHGGSVASATEAITNLVHRVNQIFEQDMGIRFVLVPNNSLVVYTNKETDPFTTNTHGSITIGEAQESFDREIGNHNYDLGILLNTGTYGLAIPYSVCDSSLKGKACMGLPEPVGEVFYTLVAHEIAHQFGASHTFNDNTGLCRGNRDRDSAMEPGTGSTLMSYAGLPCGSETLEPFMGDYFHARTIEEIEYFIADTTLCGTIIETTNRAPTVETIPHYFIPKRTPFQLVAAGSDLNGDTLSYCWEQMDVGPPQTLGDPDNGFSPLFRSYPPTMNAFRTFPHMESILKDTDSPAERLPNTDRVMHFRVTVRDDQKMGAKGSADTSIQVVSSAGPFRLTSHSNPEVLLGEQRVRWNVDGTADAPINVTHVNLLLSTNGGRDFSFPLATNTPNDGVEVVAFPRVNCTNARIKIEAVNNIFFDVNDAEITLAATPFFTRIQTVGDEILLRWTRDLSKEYHLQVTSNLDDPTWHSIGVHMNANGNEMEAIVPSAHSLSFFRIKEF